MPAVIGVVAALVTIGTGIYGAVSSADARATQEENAKKALAQQGVVTSAEKKYLDLQIQAVEKGLANTAPVSTAGGNLNNGTSLLDSDTLKAVLLFGGAAAVAVIGLRSAK